jgi:hypothetical protein
MRALVFLFSASRIVGVSWWRNSADGSFVPFMSVGIKDVIPHSTGFVMISEGWRTV